MRQELALAAQLGAQLINAAADGDVAAVTALLNGGADVNFAGPDDWTALMFAAQNGHTETVTALLNGGADVNFARPDGATALMFAAQNGHTEAVTALLNGGADVNFAGPDGWTALIFAAQNGRAETVNKIITNTATSQRNNGTDWQVMVFGNQTQQGQLIPLAQNLLTRETATPLATILPEGELRNSIVENYQRNAENLLNQNAESKIAKLRELKLSLETKFLALEGRNSSSSASSSAINTESRNRAEALANSVVVDFVIHPEKLQNIQNYLVATRSLLPEGVVAEVGYQVIATNSNLRNASQNLALENALRDLIVTTSQRRNGSSSAAAATSSSASATTPASSARTRAADTSSVVPPSPGCCIVS